jgi:hypothetical protein
VSSILTYGTIFVEQFPVVRKRAPFKVRRTLSCSSPVHGLKFLPVVSPFTLPPGSAQGFGMGDLRNKVAKQIRDERHRQYMARKYPPKPPPPPVTCRCGLTWQETTLYGFSGYKNSHLNGLFCMVCMPTCHKMEFIDIMVTQGIPYDAEEHGE